MTPPALRTRLLACAGVMLAFMLLYGGTNQLAHWRGTTRSMAFEWEFQLPRITAFVIPYWSIDFMLVLAPLFTVRAAQLRTLLWRLGSILVVSCTIFLLYPCRCGYPRTIPDDWTAPLFQILHFFDLPYNQWPSLHVSEALVAAAVILPRLPALWRPWAALWIALGCAGILFTHQHHLIDLLTGAALGMLVLWRVKERSLSQAGQG
jgi:membrane-associated phospholipid phosphatase